MEIRWWQRYLRQKPKEEYLSWKKKYWLDFMDKIGLNLTPGAKVLDAGCGPAGIFMILDEHPVDAVDPLLDRYERDLTHFRKTDYPFVRFFNAPIEQFTQPEPYDYVFCLNAINHVADLKLSFDRLVSQTKPGGVLIVSIDAHNHRFLKYIFRWFQGDILHPHQFDLQEYEEMLTQRGCSIQKSMLFQKGFIFNYYVLVAVKK